jgi:hypothetical protein
MALSGGFPGASVGASTPSPRTNDKSATRAPALPAPPSDPYGAFLNEVAAKSESCKKHAEALQALLKQREGLIAPIESAGSEQKTQHAAAIAELDQKIAAEELALNECQASETPAEPPATPPTVPLAKDGSVIPIEKLKETYFPPVPAAPPAITVPPAPTGESAYVDFLAAHAGGSPTLWELVEDVRQLLEERREAAVRYLNAAEGIRPFLAAQIYALSQRITETADGIREEPETAEPTQTAGI